jgi:hypothetical protein
LPMPNPAAPHTALATSQIKTTVPAIRRRYRSELVEGHRARGSSGERDHRRASSPKQ